MADPVERESSVAPQLARGRAESLPVTMIPADQQPTAAPTWTVEQARDGLAAAGWRIVRFDIQPGLGSNVQASMCNENDSACDQSQRGRLAN